MTKKTMSHPAKIIRNFFVVFGILSVQSWLLTQEFVSSHLISALMLSLLWALYEFKRLYKIDLSGIKSKRGAKTILLP